MKQHNTAVLIFANSGREDATRKAIGNSAELFQTLTYKALQTVKASGLPYIHLSEEQQVGHTFGERFTNAIKQVYAQGYDNIITIGNDTPHLTASQLTETAKQLQQNRFVLGPSTDGGFYLMGLHKSQFDEQLFIKLPWQSRRLAKRITLLLSTAKVDVVKLEMLQDIDVQQDVKAILNSVRFIAEDLRALLIIVVNSGFKIFSIILLKINQLWEATLYNKGSPRILNS